MFSTRYVTRGWEFINLSKIYISIGFYYKYLGRNDDNHTPYEWLVCNQFISGRWQGTEALDNAIKMCETSLLSVVMNSQLAVVVPVCTYGTVQRVHRRSGQPEKGGDDLGDFAHLHAVIANLYL